MIKSKYRSNTAQMNFSDVAAQQVIFAETTKMQTSESFRMELSATVRNVNARLNSASINDSPTDRLRPSGNQPKSRGEAGEKHNAVYLDSNIEEIVNRHYDRFKLAYTSTPSQPCFGPIFEKVTFADEELSETWKNLSSQSFKLTSETVKDATNIYLRTKPLKLTHPGWWPKSCKTCPRHNLFNLHDPPARQNYHNTLSIGGSLIEKPTAEQRNLLLRDTEIHTEIAAKSQFSENKLVTLPSEILLDILMKLNVKNLMHLSQSCLFFRTFLRNENISGLLPRQGRS